LPKADLAAVDTALRRNLMKNAPPGRLSANKRTEPAVRIAATGPAKARHGVEAKARETVTALPKAADEAMVRVMAADLVVVLPVAPPESDRTRLDSDVP
jgi:hypothetical protein